MDVLTDMLERSRARGAAFSHSTIRGPWGLRFDGVPGLAVHGTVEGEAHLSTAEDTLRLLPGDIVLIRGGLDHQLASEPGRSGVSLAEFMEQARVHGSPRRFVSGAGGEPAVFFCGAYVFEGDICERLLQLLPDTMRLRPAAGSALRTTLDLLAREMLHDDPGQQTLLDRLLDVALVQILREHFAAQGAAAPAWFRASADPQIGPALRAVHDDPGRRWTVEELAAEAMLSRAAFARRFTAQLGVAPLASEFSFAAAFKRHHGVAPGRWRITMRRPASSPRTPLPADRPALRS